MSKPLKERAYRFTYPLGVSTYKLAPHLASRIAASPNRVGGRAFVSYTCAMASSNEQLLNERDESGSRALIERLQSGSTPWVALLMLTLAAYVYLHVLAAQTMPLPWIDESHFLWQAVAFSEHGSLFAPELNPERTILWMPPGYLVTMGAIFKVTGVSLSIARHVSMLAMLGAILLICKMVKPYGFALVNLIVGAGYFLSLPSIRAGNVARMEALVWLMVVAGFSLILKRKQLLGLAIMALSVLVHPNGFYFFVFALILCLFDSRRKDLWRRPSRIDIIAIGGLVAVWASYFVYIGANWQDFQLDMSIQFARKSSYNSLSGLISLNNIGEFFIVIVFGLFCWRKSLPVGRLFFLAIPAWLVYKLGIEMWYKFYYGMGYFLLAVIVIVATNHYLSKRSIQRPRFTRPLVLAAAAVVILVFAIYWYHGRISTFAYLTDADIAELSITLDSLAASKPGSVIEFFPSPDAFSFMKLRDKGLRFSNPKFCVRQPDFFLIRRSRLFQWHYNPVSQGVSELPTIDSTVLPKYLIRQREETEKWYLIPTHPFSESHLDSSS